MIGKIRVVGKENFTVEFEPIDSLNAKKGRTIGIPEICADGSIVVTALLWNIQGG